MAGGDAVARDKATATGATTTIGALRTGCPTVGSCYRCAKIGGKPRHTVIEKRSGRRRNSSKRPAWECLNQKP